MSTVTKSQVEPVSASEIKMVDPDRSAEIEQKHRLVAEFLESHHYDAILLEKPGNFSWFTAGSNSCRLGPSDTTAALFITPDARVLVTTNVESGRLFDWEIPGAGFQLKQRPWHEPRHILMEDLCRGRTVASDTGFGATEDVSVHLTSMRIPLTVRECQRMRELGREVVHAVEATARQCKPGQSEAEIAGEVAHRLIKRQITPLRIQAAADGRSRRYRHWSYSDEPFERYCVISALASRGGLCLGASRTVAFGHPPEDIRDAHHRSMLVHATGMHFSKNNWELADVWQRIARIYEKFGYVDEWEQSPQAEIIGYTPAEVSIVPRSEFRLTQGMAVHWHPSIGASIAGDTVLVGPKGTERLTPLENWPRLTVEVKGVRIECPEILRRDVGAGGGRGTSTAPKGDSADSVFDIDSAEPDGRRDDALRT